MKLILLISFLFIVNLENSKPRPIPADLKDTLTTDFFKPDEILRIWIFPEGGSATQGLIEITKSQDKYSARKYTYLLERFRTDKKFDQFRENTALELNSKKVSMFMNYRLLHKDVKPLGNETDDLHADVYRIEYRNGNQAHFFHFMLQETSNTNLSKIKLMEFIKSLE